MIRNLTQHTILAKQFWVLKGFGKMKGLLGENEAKTLVFETRFGIHTFFLKFPIDLLVLDDNGVVKLARTVKPNRIVFWNIRFKTVIELPLGTLHKTRTKIGDIIAL
ncbi:MAG: DUF192 domain-containing protein [Candidatus Levyibacteriota bacterium]